MRCEVVPVLEDLRALYAIEGQMPRFEAYVALAIGQARGEPLPIGAFSPMGQRQPAYLNALLEQNAETIAQNTALEVCHRLGALPDVFRVMLVVVDQPRNGWTQRTLSDADWRFSSKTDALPRSAPPVGFDRWVSVQLWTDVQPTPSYVRQETSSALYRALHQRRFGYPRTLGAMLEQEGHALRFAGVQATLEPEELEYSRAVLEPLRQSRDYPTQISALYGDDAARAVGYTPLGLSARAGFELALAEAGNPLERLGMGDPEAITSRG